MLKKSGGGRLGRKIPYSIHKFDENGLAI